MQNNRKYDVLAYDSTGTGSLEASYDNLGDARQYACQIGKDPKNKRVFVRSKGSDEDMRSEGEFEDGQWTDLRSSKEN
jgi:hypothetical protein